MPLNNAIVRGESNAARVTAALVRRSCWFALTPLPDDAWCFEFKPGEGIAEFIRQVEAGTTYYLLAVTGGVEVELYGPYATDEEQGREAKRIHAEQDDACDSLFHMQITGGVPEVGEYSGGFFEDED